MVLYRCSGPRLTMDEQRERKLHKKLAKPPPLLVRRLPSRADLLQSNFFDSHLRFFSFFLLLSRDLSTSPPRSMEREDEKSRTRDYANPKFWRTLLYHFRCAFSHKPTFGRVFVFKPCGPQMWAASIALLEGRPTR